MIKTENNIIFGAKKSNANRLFPTFLVLKPTGDLETLTPAEQVVFEDGCNKEYVTRNAYAFLEQTIGKEGILWGVARSRNNAISRFEFKTEKHASIFANFIESRIVH